jgi:outer membrane protein assembly factor BamB
MNVATGEEVWNYDGGESIIEKLMFASEITSGAERLQNGNTLITLSMQGRIYEVTADGTIAWSYLNDHRDDTGRFHQVFKARKYDSDGTMWGSRLPITTPFLSALCH